MGSAERLFSGRGLYNPLDERDACGVGFVADIQGIPSHNTLQLSLKALRKLSHRGAMTNGTSDGTGVLMQLPVEFFAGAVPGLTVRNTGRGNLGVGMVFLPGRDQQAQANAREQVHQALSRNHLGALGWRRVPVDERMLGNKALITAPLIEQVIVTRPERMDGDQFERALYLSRKAAEAEALKVGIDSLYFPSFSSRTIVFKGLVDGPNLSNFYPDLKNTEVKTALAIIHQRYSTNTLPSWQNSQPFNTLGHNGEINTITGNRIWTGARESKSHSPVWGEDPEHLFPLIRPGGSDSADLDRQVEFLVRSGMPISEAMAMVVPFAWENDLSMDPAERAFCEFNELVMNPWDGPALLVFTDGVQVGAVLDRNGLRPARSFRSAGGIVAVTSEAGVVPVDEEDIIRKGRVGPGQMIVVDTAQSSYKESNEIRAELAAKHPYGEAVSRTKKPLSFFVPSLPDDAPDKESHQTNRLTLNSMQVAFGMAKEDITAIIDPMSEKADSPIFSMGDDTPPAILSASDATVDKFLKQRFAEVTNPPIDPIREKDVMSLRTILGPRPNPLGEVTGVETVITLETPFLDAKQMEQLRNVKDEKLAPVIIDTLFDTSVGPEGLSCALDNLVARAVAAAESGNGIIVLSDKSVDPDHAPIPMLVALGAVHQQLLKNGTRLNTSLVVETGSAWDVHQFALLAGYGADAINPWLALETVETSSPGKPKNGQSFDSPEIKAKNYQKAVEKGLLKVMSKMGISTFAGYHGAQVFDSLGLSQEVLDRCFTGSVSPLGGIGFYDIGEDAIKWHRAGIIEGTLIQPRGQFKFERQWPDREQVESHAHRPEVVTALLDYVNAGADKRAIQYAAYSYLIKTGPPRALRDLLDLVLDGPGIPVDEVESALNIARTYFISTAMSLGALAPKPHMELAMAMNSFGGRSNSGEGGERPEFYGRDEVRNKIKQVASARFGVTAAYLADADELEIKMAQGAKPGEGGQLPAHKVTVDIAALRNTIPGIELISPPPHHDIYSIEDLAQLIYDLKQMNPEAKVGVKLVAERGIGTIASGVAKAGADYVLVSGANGGTGAAPLSSIHNTGLPWELGLREVQESLIINDLRGKITVRTDGGLQNGEDVVKAALLGAEEYGFGTALVETLGCRMARACHLNTCPTGIATQQPDKMEKYKGTPEDVVAFCLNLAQEVRIYLARFGAVTLQEVIGRTDLLTPAAIPEAVVRAEKLDLTPLLYDPDPSGIKPRRRIEAGSNSRPEEGENKNLKIVEDSWHRIQEIADAGYMGEETIQFEYDVDVSDRTLGATLSGKIAKKYGISGEGSLRDGTVRLRFKGSAGQSFAAWAAKGMEMTLEGQAQDGVAKGLSGGIVTIKPPERAKYASDESVIVGNAVGYGATSGQINIAGQAGERFAVRNSGATLIAEGIGDHGCEYMTGGKVLVLGKTGKNFAAGMSAGVAYVFDENAGFDSGEFAKNVNMDMVSLEKVMDFNELTNLYEMIREHAEKTGSTKARHLIDNWDSYDNRFVKIAPATSQAPVQAEIPEAVINSGIPLNGSIKLAPVSEGII